jgi:hypothetical protein
LDIDTNVCVCFLYVLWTYQRYSEENYNSIWLNGHWMRGNRESKMNIIFIYHLNIHILFLNLTFTCNERRRFSRVVWSGDSTHRLPRISVEAGND